MKTYDITFTGNEAWTVVDLLSDYIKENEKDASDETRDETYREVSHECAVNASRIMNKILETLNRGRW